MQLCGLSDKKEAHRQVNTTLDVLFNIFISYDDSNGREHRNSYYMARKIQEHIYMNAGKTNERTISVRTLLKAAPFLATEEEVQSSDRHFDRRITKPFTSNYDCQKEKTQYKEEKIKRVVRLCRKKNNTVP